MAPLPMGMFQMLLAAKGHVNGSRVPLGAGEGTGEGGGVGVGVGVGVWARVKIWSGELELLDAASGLEPPPHDANNSEILAHNMGQV